MIIIRTVCSNGIGSSLMAASVVSKLCNELNIEADVKSIDLAGAQGEKADLYILAERLAAQLPASANIAIIRSYINKNKIAEDVTDAIKQLVK